MKSQKFKKQKRANKGNQVQKGKHILRFDRIKRLKYIKNIVANLPLDLEYKIEDEVEYLRHISSIIPFFNDVKLEQIPFIICQIGFRKIVCQLIRQTQHKQIIVALLILLVKGIQQYSKTIQNTLYDTLEFMIEFQYQNIQPKLEFEKMKTNEMGKTIVASQVQILIKQIMKWYAFNKSIRQKYASLLGKIDTKRS